MRRAFTLMELLVVILIVAIIAGLVVSGLSGAYEQARAARTRAIVSKLDSYITERWESYRTKPVRAAIPAGATAQQRAAFRLAALRELQRVELPERISDLCTDAELADLGADNALNAATINVTSVHMTTGQPVPAVAKSMKRLAKRPGGAWSNDFQGAECLYLIVSTCRDGDKAALDYFSPDEIGDVDGDGRKEILDGWGRPIEFLRWCPGYTKEQQAVTEQTEDVTAPDPFDPLKVDSGTFAIRPLIYSAGPDGEYDVAILAGAAGSPFAYWLLTPPNDPYYAGTTARSGQPFDTNANSIEEWADNITNHWNDTP